MNTVAPDISKARDEKACRSGQANTALRREPGTAQREPSLGSFSVQRQVIQRPASKENHVGQRDVPEAMRR
jgi:hypothetical protein